MAHTMGRLAWVKYLHPLEEVNMEFPKCVFQNEENICFAYMQPCFDPHVKECYSRRLTSADYARTENHEED